MRFLLSVEEYAVLSAAATREGLADGAYAAQAALAAARGSARPEYAVLRELIGALMQAAGQVRRVGVNLNQSVVALHATGEFAEQLAQYARVADRAVLKLDGVADEVRTRLP